MRRDLALQMLRRVAASARMLQPPAVAPVVPAATALPTKP